MRWTAVLLAGSRPGIDPFAQQHGTDLKALIPVCGTPMVRRVADALLGSDRIGSVLVLAQQPERIGAVLPAHPRLTVQQSGRTIAATLETLCFDASIEWPLLVTTADHALLDQAMIDDFCTGAGDADIAIGVVERRPLLERFPQSNRTWLRFRGGAFTGANLFALRSPKILPALELWRSVEQDRKKVLRLLWILGPVAFLGALLRLRTIDGTLRQVGRSLGLSIRAVELSDPLAAIDVDKPVDHMLVEAILEGRA